MIADVIEEPDHLGWIVAALSHEGRYSRGQEIVALLRLVEFGYVGKVDMDAARVLGRFGMPLLGHLVALVRPGTITTEKVQAALEARPPEDRQPITRCLEGGPDLFGIICNSGRTYPG
jgi:hypothetical protein